MNFLEFLSTIRTPLGDAFFQACTFLGQEVLVVGIICWLYWCRDKKLAWGTGFAYFFSGILVQGLKITFRVPRPWVRDPSFLPVSSAVSGATGYSFPSGHTQSATALYGTFFLHAKKARWKALCLGIILLVIFSRMYLGVHTPADVTVAFLLTSVVVWMNYFLLYRGNIAEQHAALFSAVVLISSLALGVYALVLSSLSIADAENCLDCLKASGAGAAFALGFYLETTRIRFAMPEDMKQALIRFLLGIVGTLLILKGMKPLFGSSPYGAFGRYFLTVVWVVVLYPVLFTWYQKRKAAAQ